jgi:MFS transporter, MHS family, proline/betaine transporter
MPQPSAPLDVLNNPAGVDRPEEAVSRKAVIAGAIGNFVEWYDFVLYGASAPILAKVFFSNESPQTALLATFATFAVAFVARPFGAFFLGNLGDRSAARASSPGSCSSCPSAPRPSP